MIKCIIFDLDDTLCDYQQAKNNAIQKLNEKLKLLNVDLKNFWETYNVNEPLLYRKFLDKCITRDEYRLHRYSDILDKTLKDSYQISLELNNIYMENANKKITLFHDVKPILQLIKETNIILTILTNGPADGQRDKYNVLGLANFIPTIHICEEIGFAKPSSKSYKYVLEHLFLESSEVIMVGDSIRDDYEGAEKLGIKAVLIDRLDKHKNFYGHKISSMNKLIEIIYENS